MADDVTVPIAVDADIVVARGEGRALAGRLGFSRTDATLIATAISEIGRNILIHAGAGEVEIGRDALLGQITVSGLSPEADFNALQALYEKAQTELHRTMATTRPLEPDHRFGE